MGRPSDEARSLLLRYPDVRPLLDEIRRLCEIEAIVRELRDRGLVGSDVCDEEWAVRILERLEPRLDELLDRNDAT